jgi:hypothetical protein
MQSDDYESRTKTRQVYEKQQANSNDTNNSRTSTRKNHPTKAITIKESSSTYINIGVELIINY